MIISIGIIIIFVVVVVNESYGSHRGGERGYMDMKGCGDMERRRIWRGGGGGRR